MNQAYGCGVSSDHRCRQQRYYLLARAFLQEPSLEMLDAGLWRDAFAAGPQDAVSAAAEKWLDAIAVSQAGSDPVQLLQDLRLDYYQLFVGPGEVLAPPWESFYRTPDHTLFGPPTLEVRHTFGRYGLKAPHENREPDDHIGLELAFLSVLAQRTADAQESAGAADAAPSADIAQLIREQRDFIDHHLARWVDEFAARVVSSAKTSFFRGLGGLVQTQVACDRA